jgi:nitrogen regulatory protein PII
MPAHAMKLVTIVCEASAREPITQMLQQAGAAGCTVCAVDGADAHGGRAAEPGEVAHVKIEVVVSADLCERLMARVEQEFFQQYTVTAFESDVRVRRPGRFF